MTRPRSVTPDRLPDRTALELLERLRRHLGISNGALHELGREHDGQASEVIARMLDRNAAQANDLSLLNGLIGQRPDKIRSALGDTPPRPRSRT